MAFRRAVNVAALEFHRSTEGQRPSMERPPADRSRSLWVTPRWSKRACLNGKIGGTEPAALVVPPRRYPRRNHQ